MCQILPSIQSNFTLHFKGSERFETLEAQYGELRAWLTTKIHWFEQSHLAKGQAKLEYNDYQKFCLDFEEKKEIYNRMCQLWHTRSLVGVSPEAWMEIDTNWQKVEAQVDLIYIFIMFVVVLFFNIIHFILD